MKKIFLIFAFLISVALCSAQDALEKISDYPTGYLKGSYLNSNFGTIDGVLYLFMASEPYILVRYPAGDTRESFTIPNTVTRIARGAFQGCRLKELIIPNSIFYIGDNSFEGAEIESFVVSGSDVSTGMSSVGLPQDEGTRYYDLSGQSLPNPSRGVNIKVEGGTATKVLNP